MPAGPGLPRAPPSTWTTSLSIDSLIRLRVGTLARRGPRASRSGGDRRSQDGFGSQRESPGVVRGGVPLAQGLVEVVYLVAAVDELNRLVGIVEVDAEAIPRELPGDDEGDLARGGLLPDGRCADPGLAERTRDARHGPPVLGCVEQLERPLELALAAGRDRVHLAGLAATPGEELLEPGARGRQAV